MNSRLVRTSQHSVRIRWSQMLLLMAVVIALTFFVKQHQSLIIEIEDRATDLLRIPLIELDML